MFNKNAQKMGIEYNRLIRRHLRFSHKILPTELSTEMVNKCLKAGLRLALGCAGPRLARENRHVDI
jgi:hypothetical protein